MKKFLKSFRLLKRKDFLFAQKNKKRIFGSYITLDIVPFQKKKIGITASSKFGSSVERNRFKRLVREAFRLCYNELPEKKLLVVYPRKLAKEAKLMQIQKELVSLSYRD